MAAAVLGGRSFSGTELRKLFHLNATSFTITAGPDEVCFETKGYGHRVGLSQYGARAMALEGSGYEQILEYYYSGVSVGPYERP